MSFEVTSTDQVSICPNLGNLSRLPPEIRAIIWGHVTKGCPRHVWNAWTQDCAATLTENFPIMEIRPALRAEVLAAFLQSRMFCTEHFGLFEMMLKQFNRYVDVKAHIRTLACPMSTYFFFAKTYAQGQFGEEKTEMRSHLDKMYALHLEHNIPLHRLCMILCYRTSNEMEFPRTTTVGRYAGSTDITIRIRLGRKKISISEMDATIQVYTKYMQGKINGLLEQCMEIDEDIDLEWRTILLRQAFKTIGHLTTALMRLKRQHLAWIRFVMEYVNEKTTAKLGDCMNRIESFVEPDYSLVPSQD